MTLLLFVRISNQCSTDRSTIIQRNLEVTMGGGMGGGGMGGGGMGGGM